jgi:uncharacterized membrane protein YhiD involved in acid resistance
MTINDIFKNDFIEQTTGSLSLLEMMITLGIALMIGVGIFYVYKATFQGVMYSKTFNVSLVILSLISATIIIGVTNNIVLSLGMVGALSIVRFRTSIKDPIDVVYMFWAIGSGIIVGAGLYVLSLVSFVLISAVLFYFVKADIKMEPYLLIVGYETSQSENEIFEALGKGIDTYKIKSKTKTPEQFELMVEIRSKTDNSFLVNAIDAIDGVVSTAMLSYDGDYAA